MPFRINSLGDRPGWGRSTFLSDCMCFTRYHCRPRYEDKQRPLGPISAWMHTTRQIKELLSFPSPYRENFLISARFCQKLLSITYIIQHWERIDKGSGILDQVHLKCNCWQHTRDGVWSIFAFIASADKTEGIMLGARWIWSLKSSWRTIQWQVGWLIKRNKSVQQWERNILAEPCPVLAGNPSSTSFC